MEYIAILVVLLITFSVTLLPNQWDLPKKEKRKHTNTKYKLPADFWKDYNEMQKEIHEMTEDNARLVFQSLNDMNEKYRHYFMNYGYDERMTNLITKYNARISILNNQKTK